MLVGSRNSKREFGVHKERLCKTSKFFETACSKPWMADDEKTITLHDTEPTAFQVYVHWTYTEKLDTSFMPNSPYSLSFISSIDIVRLWVLGNFLDDEAFMNDVIDHLIKKSDSEKKRFNVQTLQYTWDHTPAGCTIQRLMIDIMAAGVNEEHFESNWDLYPTDLLAELARRHVTKRFQPCPTSKDSWKYHARPVQEARCLTTLLSSSEL